MISPKITFTVISDHHQAMSQPVRRKVTLFRFKLEHETDYKPNYPKQLEYQFIADPQQFKNVKDHRLCQSDVFHMIKN